LWVDELLGLLLSALASLSAFANDTAAELATCGLVFVKNPDVEMRSEDLVISTEEIRVRYRLFNGSARDVRTLLAFPLPDITIQTMAANIALRPTTRAGKDGTRAEGNCQRC
jgi:hypothetical protein